MTDSQKQEWYREVFFGVMVEGFKKTLNDKSDDKVREAMEMLDDRIQEGEIENYGDVMAQASIVVGILNEEEVFNSH